MRIAQIQMRTCWRALAQTHAAAKKRFHTPKRACNDRTRAGMRTLAPLLRRYCPRVRRWRLLRRQPENSAPPAKKIGIHQMAPTRPQPLLPKLEPKQNHEQYRPALRPPLPTTPATRMRTNTQRYELPTDAVHLTLHWDTRTELRPPMPANNASPNLSLIHI